jgi:drug/metabolite transporter (DMT)-like permease
MSRASILMLIGILVALSPHVGLPLSILAFVLPIAGALIAALAYTLRPRRAAQEVVPAQVLSYEPQEA